MDAVNIVARVTAAAVAVITAAGVYAVESDSDPVRDIWTKVAGYDGPAKWEGDYADVELTIASSDARFTPERLEALTDEWGATVNFTVVDGPADIELYRADVCRDHDGSCGGEAQLEYRNGNYIASCRIAVLEDKDSLVTHEIGHCLGLSHKHEHASNMHFFAEDYNGGWSDEVTAEDLERLAALYGNVWKPGMP